MVKMKASEVKKQLQKQEEMYGDQDGSEKESDIEETFESTFGHKPVRGETLADEEKRRES